MADMPQTLAPFVAALKDGDATPLPDAEKWHDHVQRISVSGRIVAVTEEDYYYWLEVLPPKFMSGSLFCFAEGAEAFRVFWRERSGPYVVRQLSWDETVTFCRLANIPLPD